MAKRKILAVPEGDIFLGRELEILRNHFDVKTAPGINRRRLVTLVPCTLRILNGVLRADLVFSWDAGVHAFLAVLFSKMLRKKSLVIAGGYEVAKEPDIVYGAMLHPLGRRLVKFVLRHADKLLAFSEFNRKEIMKYANARTVGLLHGTNVIDCDVFEPSGDKEDLVITTTTFVTHSTVRRIGLETFIRAAQLMPNVRFALIGKPLDDSVEYLKAIAPANVAITGFLRDGELLTYYQKAKVYCRLSYYDGFALALAEAMACECVPVVTDRGPLPEIVGEAGFYVPYRDPEATAKAISNALKCGKGKEARERIRRVFPREKRESEVIREIQELLGT